MRLEALAAALLAAWPLSSAAIAGHALDVKLCLTYEYTVVGNPVSRLTTSCAEKELTGPDPLMALDNSWRTLCTAAEGAPHIWDDLRSVLREHAYLTIALRRMTLQILPNGAIRSAEFPASGPLAVLYERRRVWLRAEEYKFDWFRAGGRGPERLLDIGQPIGAR